MELHYCKLVLDFILIDSVLSIKYLNKHYFNETMQAHLCFIGKYEATTRKL